MSIITLSGVAGAGKDEFAKVLIKNHGFKRIALADPLRELCSKVFRLDISLFTDHDKKDKPLPDGSVTLDYHHIDKIREHLITEWGYDITHDMRENMEEFYDDEYRTPREILRGVGTRLLRMCVSDTIWIELALAKIREAGGKVIVTDVRFDNERDTFRKFGALLVLIKRGDHMSEGHEHDLGTEDEYDVVFDNGGSLHEFTSNVKMWYTLRKNELEYYKVFKYD